VVSRIVIFCTDSLNKFFNVERIIVSSLIDLYLEVSVANYDLQVRVFYTDLSFHKVV
jgi:hypothetical protein